MFLLAYSHDPVNQEVKQVDVEFMVSAFIDTLLKAEIKILTVVFSEDRELLSMIFVSEKFILINKITYCKKT